MPTPLRHLGFCLVLLGSPFASAAQAPAPDPSLAEQTLESLLAMRVDTVSAAAKREQLVTEAPSSVTVITAEQIAAYGWRTMGEVLRAVRGFHVTYDRNYTYLGARGFGRPSDYNNRVLVLVNGHRLNDNVYDATGLGTDFPIDLQLVRRIEVIRGPGSALYGTSAFFAVIDVITRQGGELGGGEASLESASFGTWRSRGSWGTSDGQGRDVLLSASWLSSGGVGTLVYPEYDDPVRGPGVSRGADGDRAASAYAALRIGGLAVESAIIDRAKVLPAGAWDTRLGDPRSRTVDRRAWTGASWHGALRGTTVTARVHHDHFRYDGTYAGDEGDPYSEYAIGDWLTGEVTLARRLGSDHRLTVGTEYREHLRQLQSVDHGDGPAEESRRSRQLGLYLQDEWALTSSLTAVIGARADYWSLAGWSANPRLGLVLRPDADTSVKLLYGSAFRAPNAYERFYMHGSFMVNPRLEPERLRTAELVAERYLGGRLRVTGAFYVTRIHGLVLQFERDGLSWFENSGDVEALGVEVAAERRWINGVVLHGSLARQRSREHPQHTRLANSPGTLGTLRLESPLGRRSLTLAADLQAVSSRLTLRGADTPSYGLAHFTLRWVPRPRTSIAASVYNALDAHYAVPVGVEFRQDVLGQDGRTLSVRATLGF